MDHFVLHSEYQPTGDQPQAIETLVKGFREGNQFQTLLGVTGSGKTFTMANIIAALNKPTLVIAHNKTLAGQLYGEFKEFFPENAVEYFVSYYDYYQPEAYVPSSDTYIAKDSAVNEEIDRLRLSATASLTERRDVVVVASVSCIYGLGSPEDYQGMLVSLRPGMTKDREQVLRELIDIQYDRNGPNRQKCNKNTLFHPVKIASAKLHGKERAAPHAQTQNHGRHEYHQRIRRPNRRKRMFSEIPPYNQRIDHVIELLQHIPYHNRECEFQQIFHNTSLCQVVIHGYCPPSQKLALLQRLIPLVHVKKTGPVLHRTNCQKT